MYQDSQPIKSTIRSNETDLAKRRIFKSGVKAFSFCTPPFPPVPFPMMGISPDLDEMSTKSEAVMYAEHGPGIDHQIPQDDIKPARPDLWWSRIRHTYREPLSEFMGCFIMLLFGDGVVAQVVLSDGTKGTFQSISWGWGHAWGVYCWEKRSTSKSCANYKSAIDVYEGGPNIRTVPGYSNTSTAMIFCTYPAAFMTRTGQFFSEIIASALLVFSIYALQDDSNIGAGNLTPLGICFLFFGLGACFGWETAYAINPARDFGPRLMSYFLGYGHEVWSAGGYYFWIPIVAPILGCTLGGFLYVRVLFMDTSDAFPVLVTGFSGLGAWYLRIYRLLWRWWGAQRLFRRGRKRDAMVFMAVVY
ncbi:hypothetical protein B7494_g5756 [Chlorociboria aeruginascens]|nr:hypothetical protein B7494_g5756 [Chlorociboria aeruginascens]